MSRADRLALAVEAGALALPPAGPILVLRAAPSAFLDMIPRDRLRCVQGFRPLYNSLAAAGCPVSARAGEAAGPAPAMAVVNLTRSRAENLGNVAAGLAALPPGGRLVVDGAKGDGIDSLARQVSRALPLEGAFVKAHGRVFWLTRPEALPPEVALWASDAERPAQRRGLPDRSGHVLARPRRPRQPPARRRRRRPAFGACRRSRRRLGVAGGGRPGGLARHRRARPARGRGAGARRRPRQRRATRGRASTGPTLPASGPECRPATR